ncbi:MAG: hypothetical protein LBN30_00270 [Oscillospiraceae bacterium]|jgi:hypothetical protein|nr:hypothetical protein [Oscillospiraceae bacterium]
MKKPIYIIALTLMLAVLTVLTGCAIGAAAEVGELPGEYTAPPPESLPQIDAENSPEPAPEVAPVAEPQKYYVEIAEFVPRDALEVPYTLVNLTDEPIEVHAAPTLERMFGDATELVPYSSEVGWCGLADGVDANGRADWLLPLNMLYGELESGVYRLSFNVMDGGEVTDIIFGTFTVE